MKCRKYKIRKLWLVFVLFLLLMPARLHTLSGELWTCPCTRLCTFGNRLLKSSRFSSNWNRYVYIKIHVMKFQYIVCVCYTKSHNQKLFKVNWKRKKDIYKQNVEYLVVGHYEIIASTNQFMNSNRSGYRNGCIWNIFFFLGFVFVSNTTNKHNIFKWIWYLKSSSVF